MQRELHIQRKVMFVIVKSEPMSVEEKKAKIAEGNEVSNFKKNILNLF